MVGIVSSSRAISRLRSLGSLQHDPYPQQLPLLRGRGAEPSLKHRALFRLQPNLDCIGNHLDVKSGGFCKVADDKTAAARRGLPHPVET